MMTELGQLAAGRGRGGLRGLLGGANPFAGFPGLDGMPTSGVPARPTAVPPARHAKKKKKKRR
ncbi:hypothetical protein HRbin27_01865 [bacterium HR27]|nr:hypothetical protein HRbin27_01865 [bacterium HR27]